MVCVAGSITNGTIEIEHGIIANVDTGVPGGVCIR